MMGEPNYQEKRIKGYKIVVGLLAVVLLALTAMYVLQIGQLKDNRAMLTEQRDTLVSRLSVMMTDFDELQTENDTINAYLNVERLRADSLLDRLKQERTWNAAKIRSYEKEVGSLRMIMQNYVYQIDSLNTLAQTLTTQNVRMRGEVNTQRLRADVAEERAQELDTKVRKGAMILARNIRLVATNRNGSEATRSNRAAQLRTDMVLTANELANPGERQVYVRILDPDGYVLANSTNATIEIDGQRISYSASRNVDYQGADLDVNIYYDGNGFAAGKYTALIYMDGQLIGTSETSLK